MAHHPRLRDPYFRWQPIPHDSQVSGKNIYSSDNQHLQEHHLQELCLHSSEIVAIPARWDVKTGHYVVLLNEAQQIFKDAVLFLDNGDIVPFVKDDSQEVLPLRIKYHLGVVLKVIQMDAGQGS
ncbi:hypothetical protein BGZ65_000091, partial [Modicella reniformis]